jgi:hypothetical protein
MLLSTKLFESHSFNALVSGKSQTIRLFNLIPSQELISLLLQFKRAQLLLQFKRTQAQPAFFEEVRLREKRT